jgi:hypothetical protein
VALKPPTLHMHMDGQKRNSIQAAAMLQRAVELDYNVMKGTEYFVSL